MRLRIISGKFKGRLITVPRSKLVRPTTDRVRETLFNILNNKIDFNGIKVLDIYAGTGSLGLECLSRGAGKVHFVEKDSTVYKNLLKNIEGLNSKLLSEKKCKLFRMEALKFVETKQENNYDLIIADPPFFKEDIYKVIEKIIKNDTLARNGLLIIQRSIQTIEKDTAAFNLEAFKIIGDSCLYELYRQ